MIKLLRRASQLARIGLALHRARKSPSQAAAQRALAEQLGEARGLPMKVGQLLAGMGEDSAYSGLTQSVEPLPLKRIRPTLSRAWGRPYDEVVSSIEESRAAASLGQVHRARLRSGEEVAVKAQYPDIGRAIFAEMQLTGLLPSAGPIKRWGFDLNAYKKLLRENLERELSYTQEAHSQARFAAAVDVGGLHIPKVYSALCTDRVLVQEWVAGERLSVAATWPLPQRLLLARTLIQTLFKSLFAVGLVHGDPHPGNLLVEARGPRDVLLHLLDFGCMVEVDSTRRLTLLKLILVARGECEVVPFDAFVALGFDPEKLAPIVSKLPQTIPLLFKPFTEARPFDPSGWRLGERFETLLGEHRWLFRSAGPSDSLLLLRALQGLTKHLTLLEIKLPWWPLLKQVISPELIEQALAWTPPPQSAAFALAPGQATVLRIQVTRGGEVDIDAAVPASEALDLAELIPEHVQAVIDASDASVSLIQRQVTKRGLIPQRLFKVTDGDTRYEGWLE